MMTVLEHIMAMNEAKVEKQPEQFTPINDLRRGDKVRIIAMPRELAKIGIQNETIKELIGSEQTVWEVRPRQEEEGLIIYIRDIFNPNDKILWVYDSHCVRI
jgi:hypothetical protein